MLQTLARIPTAIRAALGTFRQIIYPNPEFAAGEWKGRRGLYQMMLAYYSNTAFEDVAAWWNYRMRHDLYRYTRSIYNPAAEIIDFYGAHIYPGVLTEDARRLPSGVRSAIPFAEDTDPAILKAVAQFWAWSNWQTLMGVMTTFGAMCGEVLIESDDDLESETVLSNVCWPGQIEDLELDRQGNVTFYELRYDYLERGSTGTRSTKTFRKKVDAQTIRTYQGSAPSGFGGNPAEYDNPYGFVPAVFVKHLDLGGVHGVPAIRNRVGLFDELNSLASHAHDHEHKWFDSPRVFWSKLGLQPLFKNAQRRAGGQAAVPPNLSVDQAEDNVHRTEFDDKHKVLMLRGPENGKTETLVSEPHLGETCLLIDRMLAQIERAYPETTFYSDLRKMTQVTGPGANVMMGDVSRRLDKAAANYDRASKTHFQHQLAIGGYRYNSGDWQRRTSQQEAFAPFSLDSYSNGDLDNMTILPRPLIPETSKDKADEMASRAQVVQAVADDVDALERLKLLGYDETEAQKILDRKAAADPASELDDPLDEGDQ